MNTPQFITDNKGKKLSVILPIKEYKKIMEELEELVDIRLV
jgi:PHD/YefM family antitoxin component YafN of YafNO toxin-antitoxin module